MEEGVSSKVVKILQSMYLSVKSCKRLFVGLVDSHMCVKQGEHLSPCNICFFVNDMYSCLNNGDIDSFTIEHLQICVLLFTDDTAVLSYTKQGLQTLLNNLSNYCSKSEIEVNTDSIVNELKVANMSKQSSSI